MGGHGGSTTMGGHGDMGGHGAETTMGGHGDMGGHGGSTTMGGHGDMGGHGGETTKPSGDHGGMGGHGETTKEGGMGHHGADTTKPPTGSECATQEVLKDCKFTCPNSILNPATGALVVSNGVTSITIIGGPGPVSIDCKNVPVNGDFTCGADGKWVVPESFKKACSGMGGHGGSTTMGGHGDMGGHDGETTMGGHGDMGGHGGGETTKSAGDHGGMGGHGGETTKQADHGGM